MFVFSLEFLQQPAFGPGTVCVLSGFDSGSAVKLSQDRVAVNAELQTASRSTFQWSRFCHSLCRGFSSWRCCGNPALSSLAPKFERSCFPGQDFLVVVLVCRVLKLLPFCTAGPLDSVLSGLSVRLQPSAAVRPGCFYTWGFIIKS